MLFSLHSKKFVAFEEKSSVWEKQRMQFGHHRLPEADERTNKGKLISTQSVIVMNEHYLAQLREI